MNVILLEKINHLGDFGDKVNVKVGYGRNFLIPRGKAILASKENIIAFKESRLKLEKEIALKKAELKNHAKKLNNLSLTISALATKEGKLFGAIGAAEIINAIVNAGIKKVNKKDIKFPEDQPIRKIGQYDDIEVHLHNGEFIAKLKINIIAKNILKE